MTESSCTVHDPAPSREVGAGNSEPIENFFVRALERAAEAGRFDVVAQLAKELEARRLATEGGKVVALDAERARRG